MNYNDIHTLVKVNKAKPSKVHEINAEKKTLLRQRRERTIQNAKDRQIEKANAQEALLAHTRASKASEPNQIPRTIIDAAESKDDTDEIDFFTCPLSEHKHLVPTKTSSRCETVCTEPLLGDPLPDS